MKKNLVVLNFVGLFLPLIMALIAIPKIYALLGGARFGVLSLIWSIVGVSSLFDLGVGRAANYYVAKSVAHRNNMNVVLIIKAAIEKALKYGAISGGVITIALIYMWRAQLDYPKEMEYEILVAFLIIGFVVPVQSVVTVYRGANEALGNFMLISLSRVVSGLSVFIAPLVFLNLSVHLGIISFVIFFGRLVVMLILRYGLIKEFRFKDASSSHVIGFKKTEEYRGLVSFSKWIALSSFVSPIITQSDKFLIGSELSVDSVAKYSIAYDFISQALILATAVSGVMFPSLTKAIQLKDKRSLNLCLKWTGALIFTMIITSVVAYLFAYDFFTYWLNGKVDAKTIEVAQLLSFGLVAFSGSIVMSPLLHALNKPSFVSIFEFVQMLFYLPCMLYFIRVDGIVGAATVWVVRGWVECILITIMIIFVAKKCGRFPARGGLID